MGGFGCWEFLALGTMFSLILHVSLELCKVPAIKLCIVLIQHPAVRVRKLWNSFAVVRGRTIFQMMRKLLFPSQRSCEERCGSLVSPGLALMLFSCYCAQPGQLYSAFACLFISRNMILPVDSELRGAGEIKCLRDGGRSPHSARCICRIQVEFQFLRRFLSCFLLCSQWRLCASACCSLTSSPSVLPSSTHVTSTSWSNARCAAG